MIHIAIEVFNRYEHKHIIDRETFDKVLKFMDDHMLMDSHNKNHTPYTISNIYYDTPDDYLIKPFSFAVLSARIRAMLRVKENVTGTVLELSDLSVDTTTRQVKRGETIIELSSKEYSILEYLMRNKGVIVSKEKIEENIWNDEYGSSGLGLAMVKSIVELHGGTITVSSTPDKGTTFKITLKN